MQIATIKSEQITGESGEQETRPVIPFSEFPVAPVRLARTLMGTSSGRYTSRSRPSPPPMQPWAGVADHAQVEATHAARPALVQAIAVWFAPSVRAVHPVAVWGRHRPRRLGIVVLDVLPLTKPLP